MITLRKKIPSIAIIDYGMGNIGSVRSAINACVRFGGSVRIAIASEGENLKKVDKIILPGVGAFGDAVTELKKNGLDEAIKERILSGVPFLGICLGLHLLFERSDESKGVKGLGILEGKVSRLKGKNIKVPHIGWNNIKLRTKNSELRTKILRNVRENAYVYFCHSYYAIPKDKDIIAATTDYGIKFASVITKGNIFGIQFHPEKSQKVGLKILENFIRYI